MIKISRLADYSTMILNFMASAPNQNFSASAIAEQTHVSLPTVSKLLKLLNDADLLISLRGANGGYQIAKSADQINLAEVITAIDGKPAVTECSKENHSCLHHDFCGLSGNWNVINQAILNFLKSVSLLDMRKPLSKELTISFNRNISKSI